MRAYFISPALNELKVGYGSGAERRRILAYSTERQAETEPKEAAESIKDLSSLTIG